jgi:hypothetical protein
MKHHRTYYEVVNIDLETVYYQGYKRDVAAKQRMIQRFQGIPAISIVTPKNKPPTLLGHL